uniref:Zinc finger protein n=1 Tax=Ciona savignyi TaxID=51511 RepID=H2YB13_CIOSA
MLCDYAAALLKKLKEQRNKGSYCDIEIHIGEKIFYGHKCILAAASAHLESNIRDAESNYIDETTLHRSKIQLSGISLTGFEVLFNFMYTGELQINEDNVNDVSVAALILDIQTALDCCVEFKRKKFAVANLIRTDRSQLTNPECSSSEVRYSPESQSLARRNSTPAFTRVKSDNGALNDIQINEVVSCSTTKHKTEVFEIMENGDSGSLMAGDEQPSTLSEANSEVSTFPSTSENFFNAVSNSGDMISACANFIQSFEAMNSNPEALPTLLPMGGQERVIASISPSNSAPILTPNPEEMRESQVEVDERFNELSFFAEQIEKNGEIIWRCKICKRTFRKLSYLKYVHVRLHNGNRPHVCNLCGKPFATRGNLLQHHKMHLAKSGILPFKCKFCKRAFSLKGNCQKHEKTHTKPYRCEFCTRVFSNKNDCIQHINRHHSLQAANPTIGLRCSKCLSLFTERFGTQYFGHKCV